jgi:hypothetical protein
MPRRTPRTPGNTLQRPRRPAHRPTALTDRTADYIINTVLDGNHITTACEAAGIARTTMYRWIEAANEADWNEQHDQPVRPDAALYRNFRDRLAEARAQAEMSAVAVVQRSMKGGILVSEKPVIGPDGKVARDDDGTILYERVWSQPDGRLALSYLGKSRPDVWGQNGSQRIELTGADGGPVQVETTEQAETIETLADRLAAVAAQRRAEDQDDTDTVDAELVEEDQ